MQLGRFPADPAYAYVETERLRALVSSLSLGVLVEDEARRVSLANDAFCTMFGIPVAASALLGADCAQAAQQSLGLLHDPEAFLLRIEQRLLAGEPASGDEIVFRDGRVLERDYVPISVDSAQRGHLWIYRDVTGLRRDAELDRAAAVRDELRLAIDTIPGLVFSARPDGYVDFLNQRWCDYTGIGLEQACGSGWEAAVYADDLPELSRYWRSVLRAGIPGEREARLRRFDGSYRWFLFRAVPLFDERGRIVKWYGQTTDIDDRKRAEALLAGEKRLLEMLARGSSLHDLLDTLCQVVEDNAGGCRCGVLLVNASGTKMEHGAAPNLPPEYNASLHGRPIDPEWAPCALAAWQKEQVIVPDIAADGRWDAAEWRDLASEHGLRSCWSTPIVSVERKILGTFAIYQYEPGAPTALQQELIEQFTHLASVVIERKRSEDALQQAQAELSHVTRVTTLGELAASIAHEINQPLSAIVADASACLNWLSKETPDLNRVRESLSAIVKDGVRAGDVLTRIRALLTRSALAHTPCDLTQVIHGALALVRPEFGRLRISLKTALVPGVGAVIGDPVELQQVVLNLLLNAAEAGKEVGPERRRVLVGSELEQRAGVTWVLVSVADAGVGIDERDLERLFAPFYTTKPGGLGMGLSIIRSIIERHGGELWATSNADGGATFRFALPACKE